MRGGCSLVLVLSMCWSFRVKGVLEFLNGFQGLGSLMSLGV